MEKFQENNILENRKVCVNENEEAWNKETYNAWVKRFGTAKEAAEKLKLCLRKN